jgi:hypothetical protein
MSAARVIPMDQTEWTITIDNNFNVTPQGVIVQPGDQVNYQNNSDVCINIQFEPNPPGEAVYPNMNLPVGAKSSKGFTAPSYDASANYSIYVGTAQQPGGPYALQVGVGPLYIQVTYVNGEGQCSPETAAIPVEGKLRMVETDHHSYSVGWQGGKNPFQPPLGTVGSHKAASAGTYEYSVAEGGPVLGGGGGGTIIVTN